MKPKYRIGTGTIIALMSVAILFDFIGLILIFFAVGLFINTILAILFALYSGFIFLLRGIPILSFKRAKGWTISMLGEIIPLINVLPMCSVGAGYVIYTTRKEDKEKAA